MINDFYKIALMFQAAAVCAETGRADISAIVVSACFIAAGLWYEWRVAAKRKESQV